MKKQAKSVGRSGDLAALRKEYESKAQQVLTEIVGHSTSGTLDIFTLFRLISKRMSTETFPSRKRLSAGGATPDAKFFVQVMENFEEVRSNIKKMLKSAVLKGCLQKTADSQDCEEEFLELKDACKQLRHSIMGKLQVYDIPSTKDFVILECLTRLVQICQEKQQPAMVIKSMILIWQLLKDCELTHRFVSYKNVSEIIDRLSLLCEVGSGPDAKNGTRSPSPIVRRPPMTIADRDNQTIRSIERLVAPQHLPQRPKELGDRINTLSRKLGEFSSPQQKPTATHSPRVDRSKSSQINLNLSKRFEEAQDLKEPTSRSSRIGLRAQEVRSPPDAEETGWALPPSYESEAPSEARASRYGSMTRSGIGRLIRKGQSNPTQPLSRFVGVDATFLSEASGSSISFRDLASGSKRSTRVFKESAQKSLRPADDSPQVPVRSFYPPFDEAEAIPRPETAQSQQMHHSRHLFSSKDLKSGMLDRNLEVGVSEIDRFLEDTTFPQDDRRHPQHVGREDQHLLSELGAGRKEEFIRRPMSGVVEADDRSSRETHTHRLPLSQQLRKDAPMTSRFEEDLRRLKAQLRAQEDELVRNRLENRKSKRNIVQVDSIVREVAQERLRVKFAELFTLAEARIRAKVVEAQIFAMCWDDELYYDRVFEQTCEGIHICKNDSHSALSLVQEAFDVEFLITLTLVGTRTQRLQDLEEIGLGKRSQDRDNLSRNETIINPYRYQGQIDDPWSEIEKDQLFDGFDARRLNFHFNSKSPTQKSSLAGSNSKSSRKNG